MPTAVTSSVVFDYRSITTLRLALTQLAGARNLSNMSTSGGQAPGLYRHEVLAAVFTIGRDLHGFASLQVLLWQRAQWPDAGRWAIPGGLLGEEETVGDSMSRQLAEKVDLAGVSHLEQLGVFSEPRRVPSRSDERTRVLATGFLGLVPAGANPALPEDTAWQTVDRLSPTALDHGRIIDVAHDRLRAKVSYTNIAFGLAPAEFTLAELTSIYRAVLGHGIDPSNLQRVLSRRGMIEAVGRTAPPGSAGGRPAALYRFTTQTLTVTDPFAAFRPPTKSRE